MNPYPFPRARGDAESAAGCRRFAWRVIAVYAVIFTALVAVLAMKVIRPAIEASR